MEMATEPLKRTPLFESHKALNAKLAPFAGYEMPIHYQSIIEEHQAVRRGCGLFDVSHMGEFWIHGTQAGKFLNFILTNEIAAAPEGAAVYAHMTNERGGVIDDLIAYKISSERYLLVVNASRIEADWAWVKTHAAPFDVEISNESPGYGILALQGPRAMPLAGSLIPKISAIERFKLGVFSIAGGEVIVARTGYTGEDGVELIAKNEQLPFLWEAITHAGAKFGPFSACGLGCRDTLRLEAGFPLWGHELGEMITPLEAGYGWVIKWDKDFIGKGALLEQKNGALNRKIFGLMGKSAGPVARQGAVIKTREGQNAGIVTSGSFAPSLGKPIALGFLDKPYWEQTDFVLENTGRQLMASVSKLPFYNKG
ncbi:MAG: glycine cleavage system aminomethyltransferase GcvT [Elusimicrobia bacterium]|nr:glycine cleavage system aminomethyltransferase GcvT [Elusimicrobiota bacterium]